MKKQILTSRLALGAALVLTALVSAAADDSSSVRLALQNTGVDPDASGSLIATLKSKGSLFSLTAAGLTPGNSYLLTVGDIPEATLVADTKGKARIQFTTPPKKGKAVLDFDPHGQTVSLLDGTNTVLTALVSGSGEPAGITVDERVSLQALSGIGEASLRYQASKTGVRTFSVQLKNITGTGWQLFVNGISRGDIPTQKSGGKLILSSNGSPALDFDPRGQVIDIVQDTNIVFSGELEAQIKNVNVSTPAVSFASIPSTGVDPDGVARARLRIDRDARRHFSVELEDVPAGSYELLADGALQGLINVVSDSGKTEGEIEFSSRPDSGDELPLTFDPTNTTFTVQQGAAIYFQGTLVLAGGGSNEAPTLIDETVASTGLDPDAHADARFEIDAQGRHKFSVEIEDVAAGSYQLWIGGIQRGSISAQLESSGVKGELEFSTPSDDAGELPLNFDPRGQLIEVKNGSGTFFSGLFGNGDTNTVLTVPVRIELPLFNVGPASNASAVMAFKRDDRNRQSFQVEIEDAPVGDYQLLVAGVLRGTISVTSTAGDVRGEVEFESEPDNGNLLLDFDPLGAEVLIVRDGVTYFGRTLPAE